MKKKYFVDGVPAPSHPSWDEIEEAYNNHTCDRDEAEFELHCPSCVVPYLLDQLATFIVESERIVTECEKITSEDLKTIHKLRQKIISLEAVK